jgi:uncharacterized membrane protein (DUF2068 family)
MRMQKLVRRYLGLRTVAIFEAAKGLLVLVAGFDLLSRRHRDARHAVEALVRNFHLDPASRHPHIFEMVANRLTNTHLWTLAVLAASYALIRFVEAYGLWRDRGWAEWFAVISAGLYVPIEVYELFRRPDWPVMSLFAVNVAIVIYMGWMVASKSRPGTGG